VNRLTVNKIVSIGAVEDGDNPEAQIMFWKTKPEEVSKDFELENDESRETVEPEGAVMPDEETVDTGLEDLEKARADLDAIREELAKARADIETRDEELAKERKERRTKEFLAKAEALTDVLGPAEEWAPVLDELDEKAPEALTKLEERLAVVKGQLETSEIFKELGRQEGSRTLEALVKSKQESDPKLTEVEARAAVWQENPDLVAEARIEGSHS
jgi:hypothetical protein